MLKKWLPGVFVFMLLCSCSTQGSNNQINFAGVVTKVYESSILVSVNKDEELYSNSDLISVSLNEDLEKSETTFSIGDKVRVYYDGVILESYPAQIHNVYEIVLE